LITILDTGRYPIFQGNSGIFSPVAALQLACSPGFLLAFKFGCGGSLREFND